MSPPAHSVTEATIALITAVRETAQRLEADGLTVGTGGNISARDAASGLIAITPAGQPYRSMRDDDIALVDGDGSPIRSPRPSSEVQLHRTVLRERPDVGAIVHTHSPYAAAFSVVRRPIPLICNEGLGVGEPEIPVTRFAPPGTSELGEAVMDVLGDRPALRAVLLANHGVVALGATLATAYQLAQSVEWEARIYHYALAIGEPVLLSRTQMEEITRRYQAAEGKEVVEP